MIFKKTIYTITLVLASLLVSSICLAQDFDINGLNVSVKQAGDTKYSKLTINEIPVKGLVLDFKAVFGNGQDSFDGMYLLIQKETKGKTVREVIYLNSENGYSPKMVNTGLQNNRPEEKLYIIEKILEQDGMKQKAAVFTYAVDNKNEPVMYSKAIHAVDDVTKESILHTYVSFEKSDRIELETFYDENGQLIKEFKTGDDYFKYPKAKRDNLIARREHYLEAFENDKPEQIKDFEIITKESLTEKDIKHAKQMLGSPEFASIQENYFIGSPVIIGESGEGKTFVAKSFYKAALLGLIPGFEIDEVLMLTRESLGADTKYVGQSEEKIKALLDYYQQGNGKRLVFADEVQNLKGVGTSEGSPVDHLQVLKGKMGENEFKMISTTTHSEFNGLVGGDAALERRFLKTNLTAKTYKEISNAMKYIAADYNFHNLKQDAIDKIIQYSNQFDIAGSQPARGKKLLEKSLAKQNARAQGLEVLPLDIIDASAAELYSVDPKMLIPKFAFEKVEKLKQVFDKEVIGLEEAKETLINITKQRYQGMNTDSTPPMRVFLMGAPGGGKTYISKVYAKAMGFRSVVVSMNQFQGYDAVNEFKNKIVSELRINSNTVLILDEFEKSTPKVQESILQMLNEGEFDVQEKITGSVLTRDIKASTKNASFILTSNIGDVKIQKAFINILKTNLQKTKDTAKAELAAKKEFLDTFTHDVLIELAASEKMNTAVLDRIDYAMAILPPTPTEFRSTVELEYNKWIKGYNKKNLVKLSLSNKKKVIDAIASHYKPGVSNRKAGRLIKKKLKNAVSAQLTPEKLELKNIKLKLDTTKLKFVDSSPKATNKVKQITTMHELHGHWLARFMLYNENLSNFVNIIPGDGYLGFVQKKVAAKIIDARLQTFTGLLKETIVLEAGYRAEAILGGVSGIGNGTSSSELAPKKPRNDDMSKINRYLDIWINNNSFEDLREVSSASDKQAFKVNMSKIIREMTDYIVKKGVELEVGKEAVAKVLKEGNLHEEYLDSYAEKLSAKLKINPDNLLQEALEYAETKVSGSKRKGIGFKPAETSGYNSDVAKLVKEVSKKLVKEKKFLSNCSKLYL